MKRKIVLAGVILSLFVSIFAVGFLNTAAATTATPIPVVMNNKELTLNPGAYLIDGKAMVPLKQCFEKLNATVTWHEDGQTLSVFSKDGAKSTISAENSVANIQGKAVDLGTTPIVYNGVLYGERTVLSSVIKCNAVYNTSDKTMYITDKQSYSIYTHYLGISNFYTLGGWRPDGSTAIRSTTGKQVAKAKIQIKKAGTYTMYVRAKDFPNDRPGTRYFQAGIDGSYSSKNFGKHGQSGYRWENAGTFSLSEGEHEVQVKSVTGYARCEGVIITNDPDYVPTNDAKEFTNYAVRTTESYSVIPSNFPGWAKKQVNATSTQTIENDKFKIVFYKGNGDKGAVVQNEIYMKRNGEWVVVKGRYEEFGVLALRANSSALAESCPPTDSLSDAPTTFASEQKFAGFNGEITMFNVYNYYEMGCPEWLIPSTMTKSGNAVTLTMESDNVQGTLTFSFDDLTKEPKVKFTAKMKSAGCYSFIYFNGDDFSDTSFDRVTAPFNYVEDYIPDENVVLEEYMMFTPMATFTFGEGTENAFTKGIAVDPTSVRQYVARPGDLDFGVMFRSPTGNARAQLVAPVFATKQCKFELNGTYTFSYRLLFNDSDWYENYVHVAQDIFNCVDLRTNYYASLNEAIYNTTDLIMDDVYSGFIAKDMGFANMEAEGVVSNVNNIELMQRYMLTENEEILDKRAIPVIAFQLTRNTSHSTRSTKYNNYTGSNNPTKLKQPSTYFSRGAFVGLYRMSQGRMPFMLYHSTNASGSSISGASYGPAMNDMLGVNTYSSHTTTVADNYLNMLANNTFKPIGGFVYESSVPALNSLVLAYEQTGDPKYLEGAKEVGQYIMTSVWTTGYQNGYADTNYTVGPEKTAAIPLANDTADWFWYTNGVKWRIGNDYGVFKAASESESKLTKEYAPGWIPARTGLGTEHRMTPGNGNAIQMNMWAGTMLRLAKYTDDNFFLTQARNAIIGRYANYAGYYSERYLLHDKQADYPYVGPDYNLIYWHHIPAFLALLEDFLINNVWYRSEGNIEFPSVVNSGYAYFNTNQYGVDAGEFYDENDMWLWLDRGIVEPDSVEVDYLPAKKDGVLGIAFVNEGQNSITTTITLGEKVPGASTHTETATLYDADGNKSTVQITNGKFTLTIPGRGIQTVVLHPDVKKPSYVKDYTPSNYLGETVAEFTDGKAYLIQFNDDNYYAYMYTTQTTDVAAKATFTYTYGGKTYTKTVSEYPFETIVKVPTSAKTFNFSVKVTDTAGKAKSLGSGTLRPISESAEADTEGWEYGFPKGTVFVALANLTLNDVQPGAFRTVSNLNLYYNAHGNFGIFTPSVTGKYYVYGLRTHMESSASGRETSVTINDTKINFTSRSGADKTNPNMAFFWGIGSDTVELEAGVPFVIRQNQLGVYDRMAAVALVPAYANGQDPMGVITDDSWKHLNIPKKQAELDAMQNATTTQLSGETVNVTVNGEKLTIKPNHARIIGYNIGLEGYNKEVSTHNEIGDAISYATVFDALALATPLNAKYGAADVPEDFTSSAVSVTNIGTYGDSVRVVVPLSNFDFSVYKDSLNGLYATGELVHKTTGEIIPVDSIVKSNEMRETSTVLNIVPPENFELTTIDSYKMTNFVLIYKGGAYDTSTLEHGGEMANISVLVNGVPCYNVDQYPLKDGDEITTVRPGISTFKPVSVSGNASALIRMEKANNGFGKYTISADFLKNYVSNANYSNLDGTKLFGVLTPVGSNWKNNVSADLDLENSKVVYDNLVLSYADQTDANGNPIFRSHMLPWSSYSAEDYTVEKDGKVYLNPDKVGGAGSGVADYDASGLFFGNSRLGSGVIATKTSAERYIIHSEGVSVVKIMTVSYDTNGRVTDISASDEKVITILEPYVGKAQKNQKIYIWHAKVLGNTMLLPVCESLEF